MTEGVRRLLLCVVVVALFVGGLLASHVKSATGGSQSAPSALVAAGASVIPADDVAAADWYCSAGTPATLVISSFSPKTVEATVTWTAGGEPEQVAVPSGAEVEVPPRPGSSGPQGATITVDGGQVVAMEFVSSAVGWSTAECASGTSSNWYFPEGSTLPGDSVTLSLYDPSVTPAVVNVEVLTASGEAAPTDYQGISVPAHGVVSEKLDAHATNDSEFGTVVQVDSGAIVADELTVRDSGGTKGFSDQLGMPAPESTWAFPSSVEPVGGTVTFNVMNPSSAQSEVTLDATYGAGIAVHPVEISVPAESVGSIVLGHEPGFGQSTPYAVVLRATSPVVAGRVVRGRPGRKHVGANSSGSTPGVAVGADSWVVVRVPSPLHALALTVESLGKKAVKLSITRALGGANLVRGSSSTTTLGPGESATVNPSILPSSTGPLLVVASGPIAVELDASPVIGAGMVVVPVFASG